MTLFQHNRWATVTVLLHWSLIVRNKWPEGSFKLGAINPKTSIISPLLRIPFSVTREMVSALEIQLPHT